MTDHDAGDNDSGLHSRINSSHSSGVDSASEAVGAYRRSEYPSMVTTESYPMHTGACAPYYGQGSMGYTEYPDRYSMGYQRMGQTITLTSHKIQFGCQGNSNSGFPNQRCSGPSRHQYHSIPSVGKPSWIEPCAERSQSNTKSNNRGRTTYSDDQIAELESVFNSNPYPTSQTRQRLAYKIDVPEGKVKIWFQNRRARAKKSKLSCAIPWRGTSDSSAIEERGNQNNNNSEKMSSKCSSSESNIPIAAILPLPTKTSITNSALASCVPAWRGYYDTSTPNHRSYHQNSDCSMRGACSCGDASSHYHPIRGGMDRFAHTPGSMMNNSICYDNRPYANGLRSPPPIRRLIYPFHALTQKNIKTEQDHEFAQQAACATRGVYALGNNGIDPSSISSRLYQNPTIPIASSTTTFSELRQCTPADWDSGHGISGGVGYVKPIASDVESGFDSDLTQSCAVACHSGGRREKTSAVASSSCLKTENSADLECEKESSLAANEPANQAWNERDSSNILIKAMEYTACGRNIEKLISPNEPTTVQTDTNELTEIWPTHFSGSMCGTAPPSIVG